MTLRVLPAGASLTPPLTGSSTTIQGVVYAAQPGSYLDVPDAAAPMLIGSGWIVPGQPKLSGPTSGRPGFASPFPWTAGYTYLDTTLGYVVVWDGAAWRNPATAAAV